MFLHHTITNTIFHILTIRHPALVIIFTLRACARGKVIGRVVVVVVVVVVIHKKLPDLGI